MTQSDHNKQQIRNLCAKISFNVAKAFDSSVTPPRVAGRVHMFHFNKALPPLHRTVPPRCHVASVARSRQLQRSRLHPQRYRRIAVPAQLH